MVLGLQKKKDLCCIFETIPPQPQTLIKKIMAIRKGVRYKLSNEVLSQQIDDKVILLDMANENYFELNDVGSYILEKLKDSIEVEILTDNLFEIYNIEKQLLEKDIIELLQQFLDVGLIHIDRT